MKEYDRSVDLCPVKQICLNKEMASTNIIVYDLETSGFRHSSDILQIGAIRYDMSTGQQSGHYSKYSEPTAPIPAPLTGVHHLLEHGGKLCKMSTDGVLSQLIVEPPKIVLNDFRSWVHNVNEMGEQEPKQVIMLGYNSWKFDDNFLLFHLRQKLDKDLLLLARRNVFTCNAMKLKGTLQSEFLAHRGNKEGILEMHDALYDCKAVLSLLEKK